MKNRQASSENERNHSPIEVENAVINTPQEQILLDYLIDAGFRWEEAVHLLNMREHLYENAEVRQRIEDDPHMQFARWLYTHDEIHER